MQAKNSIPDTTRSSDSKAAAHSKIARFINHPFDSVVARIVGGIGGMATGLGIAGSAIVEGGLSAPAVAIVFIAFAIAGATIGSYIINLASRNSASLSTIAFAMAGADFAGGFGTIAATALVSVTNIVVNQVTGMTLDGIFAKGVVASIVGFEQIAIDTQAALDTVPTKTAEGVRVPSVAKQVEPTPLSVTIPKQVAKQKEKPIEKAVIKSKKPLQKSATKPKKPPKTFTEKLEESRVEDQDIKLGR